ncbi:MAG: hypothetical protein AB7F76_12675 [Parvibaculaceae bacterium]
MTSTLHARDVSRAEIDAAVAAGAIDREAADRLVAFVVQSRTKTGAADEETLRLITSFNDIFVTIGLGLFLGALSYLVSGLGSALNALIIAIAAWALAEIFTRQKRMALPSIVLLVVFAFSVLLAAVAALGGGDPWRTNLSNPGSEWPLIISGLIAAGATALHWFRFHVPITIAAGCAALVVTLSALAELAFPGLLTSRPSVVLIPLGLIVFALAMRFDMSDTARQTRRADIAFWLHLLAAPLIVHPVVSEIRGGADLGISQAIVVIALFLVLSIVALIVDRRALLVSSLAYLAYAMAALIANVGWQSSTAAIAILAVGVVVLALSVLWKPLRAVVLMPLPEALRRRVPVAA